jgi:lipopolysaccharide transport protein LptA
MIRLIIILSLLVSMAMATGKADPPLKIEAEHVEVSQKDGRVVFTKGVTVTRGKYHLVCQLLEASYKAGRLVQMIASQGVTISGADFRATASKAEFNEATAQVILTGRPQLTRGKSTLEGSRVIIWLDTDRIVIEKATGVLDPNLLKPLQEKQ